MGATLVVTGVAGLVACRLAREVLRTEEVGFNRVIGIDVTHPDGLDDLDGFEFHESDVRDDVIGEILDEGDALAHLAFVTDPSPDEEEMRSVNIGGTRNVLESAVASEVGRIVYLSSAVVYGAHPDNDFPLTEDSPLRANPDFSYAEHKLEVERWLASWREAHPDLALTVLRPAIIAGRGADNFITRQMELPRVPTVRGYRPPWQFVHVDDVVSAIIHALSNGLDGPYNVAAEGWLSHDEAVELARRRPIELPEEVAFTVAERLWKLGIAEAPPGQLHYLMHPFVLSVAKLIATGWQPEHTNREAFTELVADHEPYIALRRGVRVRKRSLGLGAGLAGAALASLAIRWLREDER
jgi:nucleoside-diphosphate-sugar epimerase